MQTHRIAILVPLAVGAVAVICTLMIHALPLSATVELVRREKKLGRPGRSFWIDMGCAWSDRAAKLSFWSLNIGLAFSLSASPS